MDIAHKDLDRMTLQIIKEIAESHFVAVDCEFSGIPVRRARNGKPTLQELYEETKEAAEKYQILQVGLTVVSEDIEKGSYVARPYNFHLSPVPALKEEQYTRVWSCTSGSIGYLSGYNFDFNYQIEHGVKYLSRKEEHLVRDGMIANEHTRSQGQLKVKSEDLPLVELSHYLVKAWLAERDTERPQYLNIPDPENKTITFLNGYQKRVVHQTVQNNYPLLRTQGMPHFVRVWMPSKEEQEEVKSARERVIARAVGFRWIMEAIFAGNLSGMPPDYVYNNLHLIPANVEPQQFVSMLQEKLKMKKRVLVGHNCFTDLLFLYNCFVGDLPKSVQDFRRELVSLVTMVVDTKFLGSAELGRYAHTELGVLEGSTRKYALPLIKTPSDFDRYAEKKSPHEAGYDSLLTANIAVKLSAHMENSGKHRFKEELGLARPVAAHPVAKSDERVFDSGDGAVPGKRVLSGKLIDIEENAPQSHVYWDGKDAIADSGVNAADADSDEEGYASAVESQDYLAQKSPLDTKSLPLPLIASSYAEDDGPDTPKPPVANEPSAAFGQAGSEAGRDTVVAVKANEPPKAPVVKDEVEKIRSGLAKTNPFDTLRLDIPGPEASSEDGGVLLEDGDSGNRSRAVKKIDLMVKKKELMPRWESGFWGRLGNKLQVNACEEGEFRLGE